MRRAGNLCQPGVAGALLIVVTPIRAVGDWLTCRCRPAATG
ncbi:hypothetical protein [Actinoplanes sp. NPDC026670]